MFRIKYLSTRFLLFGSLTVLILSACTPPESGELLESADVTRLIARVWADDAEPLDELFGSQTINAGGWVTTDDHGEAKVEISGCAAFYVFRKSEFTKAACRKSATDVSGNCISSGGTGVSSSCLSKVKLDTRTVSVSTTSTWFNVFYLPESQTSLVLVYDGEVEAIPSRVPEGEPDEGLAVEVPANAFYFTNTDDQLQIFEPNLAFARRPASMDEWPRFRQEVISRLPGDEAFQIDEWLVQTRIRSEFLSLPFPPALLSPEFEIVGITGEGDLLADPRFADALATGLDWQAISKQAGRGSALQIALNLPEAQYPDLSAFPFRPDEAGSLMNEIEFPDDEARLIFLISSFDDNRPTFVLENLAGQFEAWGLFTEIVQLPRSEQAGFLAEQRAGGYNTLIVERILR